MPREILLVDGSHASRSVTGAALKARGFEVHQAGDGAACLAFVRRRKPAIILLDIRLPDMDGVTVCQKLRRNAATRDIPILVLTAEVDKSWVVKAIRAGAKGYLIKAAEGTTQLIGRMSKVMDGGVGMPGTRKLDTTTRLLDRVEKTIENAEAPIMRRTARAVDEIVEEWETAEAPSPLVDIGDPQTLEDFLDGVQALDPLSWAAQELNRLLAGDADLHAVVAAIGKDPGMTQGLARFAPAHDGELEESELLAVVRRLGARNAASLGICLSLMLSGKNDEGGNFRRAAFWEHCIAVGLLMRRLGIVAGHPDPGALMAAGLLHDIGKLVLDEHLHEEFQETVGRAALEGIPLHRAERRAFGVDHRSIGRRLVERWSFREEDAELIYHHEHTWFALLHAKGSDTNAMLLAKLAKLLVKAMAIGDCGDDQLDEVAIRVQTRLKLDPEKSAIAVADLVRGMPKLRETILPTRIRKRSAQAQGGSDADAGKSGGAKSLLLLEPPGGRAIVLPAALSSAGYRVQVHRPDLEAVAAARTGGFDAIVMLADAPPPRLARLSDAQWELLVEHERPPTLVLGSKRALDEAKELLDPSRDVILRLPVGRRALLAQLSRLAE